MEIKNHFGVYGVCLQEGKLLCIEKRAKQTMTDMIEQKLVRRIFSLKQIFSERHTFYIVVDDEWEWKIY